ncbi:MAG: alpha/beta fold hydrolase [Alphaproteobacteria bacterium]|nr:alpha/beta fold hydrolase [Alphaproteobacteria bacterium]MBU1514112.1 alpha/beta fold hydrolase [Alphaproteobacteria bacterium]MBU2096239.1 alpha/beta fold hydrolase [Alphaproteobacteria bacterium]MBU2151193.1 alpha/beta fold hydrolase [Alphaproteobacteria bacterium]MBU2307148.1 alpha/beta fold hydrolase [Alphaproteobacteria bacterium]
MQLKTVQTRHVPVQYLQGGSGPALVFLHGAGGVTADDPLLAELAKTHTVYAPLIPGYGDSEEAPEIRDMLDFTLHGWDAVAALGLTDPILVGHSMGGMIAAEMAAIAPNDVSRLALIAPAGLWDDDHPIADLFATLPYEMPELLFHDAEVGTAMLTAGRDLTDPNFLQTYLVNNARQLGMAGRILFPIPERGLSQRLYRIKAKTVIVWGDSDRLIPPVYAHGFKKGIAGAELVSIPEAGHMITLEKPGLVAAAIAKLG